jgi:hypothetical protein
MSAVNVVTSSVIMPEHALYLPHAVDDTNKVYWEARNTLGANAAKLKPDHRDFRM